MARLPSRRKLLCFKILAVFLFLATGLLIAESALRLLPSVRLVIFPEGLMEPSINPELCYELNPEWPGRPCFPRKPRCVTQKPCAFISLLPKDNLKESGNSYSIQKIQNK